MDDKREGRPSFKTSDVVKNEVRDVIDGDRRLTVREVADKCAISKKRYMQFQFKNYTWIAFVRDVYPDCYQKKIWQTELWHQDNFHELYGQPSYNNKFNFYANVHLYDLAAES
jgi:hypothetical protein